MGVEPSREVLEWLWETRFAAVAGDAPAFERSPVGLAGSGEEGEEAPGVVLHQWLLGGWGMPIGEMFDLEGLSAHCREVGRWSFFLSSVPLKVSLSKMFFFFFWAKEKRIDGYTIGAWWCCEPTECSCHLLN